MRGKLTCITLSILIPRLPAQQTMSSTVADANSYSFWSKERPFQVPITEFWLPTCAVSHAQLSIGQPVTISARADQSVYGHALVSAIDDETGTRTITIFRACPSAIGYKETGEAANPSNTLRTTERLAVSADLRNFLKNTRHTRVISCDFPSGGRSHNILDFPSTATPAQRVPQPGDVYRAGHLITTVPFVNGPDLAEWLHSQENRENVSTNRNKLAKASRQTSKPTFCRFLGRLASFPPLSRKSGSKDGKRMPT